jgi:hypothetical protein
MPTNFDIYVFITVCPADLILPDLGENLNCYVPDYCTGIECCVEIPQIGRTFHVYLLLDTCLHKLKIGIENLGLEKTYFDFKFGMYPIIYVYIYSGTWAIQNLSFSTSCDIRQKFMVPKYFC